MSQQVPERPQNSSSLKQNPRDVFKYMVTPDRIPEFIIPSLDILQAHRLFGKEEGVSGDPAPGPQVEVRDQRNCSALTIQKDCSQPSPLLCCSTEQGIRVEDIPDQVTRAALSLPHLPKITTPYGFVSLGESPHVTTEEALFFQVDLASVGNPSTKRYSDPQMSQRYCDAGTSVVHADASLKDHHPQLAPKVSKPSLPRRKPSLVRSNSGGTSASSVAVCPTSHSSPEFQVQKPRRNLFKKIVKKHFAQRWRLKAGKFLAH